MKNFKKIIICTILLIGYGIPIFAELVVPTISTLPLPKTFANDQKMIADLTQALKNNDDAKMAKIFESFSQYPVDPLHDLIRLALYAKPLNYDLIQLLLDNGANLHGSDISHLIQADSVEFIEFLIDHNVTMYHQGTNSSCNFQHYSDNVKELYNPHEKSNNFGELLCIAVKKEHLDTMVYPAKPGGIKVPGIASEHIKNCKQNALVHKNFHDTDHSFYCLAVSDIPGEYGTKYTIRSLNLADPEKYEAYKQARDAFAAKLKDEFVSN